MVDWVRVYRVVGAYVLHVHEAMADFTQLFAERYQMSAVLIPELEVHLTHALCLLFLVWAACHEQGGYLNGKKGLSLSGGHNVAQEHAIGGGVI